MESHDELEFINDHRYLIEICTELENDTFSTMKQIDYVKEILRKISNTDLILKLNVSIEKKPDLKSFMEFNIITYQMEDRIYGFIPLTSVVVEQSFSMMKTILEDNRRRLKVETLEMLLFLYFNKN